MTVTVQQSYARAVEAGAISADPVQQALLSSFENLRHHLASANGTNGIRNLFKKAKPAPRGLYIWGGVGRGKSMLMDLFVETVTVSKRRVHFHAFMQEIHAALHEVRKTNVDDALKPVAKSIAAKVRLLALDEMQISDIADAMIVGRLFEQLMADGVMLVTTSNRPPDDLYLNGLNRDLFLPFIALLNQKLEVRELASSTDYRQATLIGKQVYFCPVTTESKIEIDAIWHDLTGGAAGELIL
ncbi:MAG: cell division protein ZapE, partial [Paracoccaceae bacterium]